MGEAYVIWYTDPKGTESGLCRCSGHVAVFDSPEDARWYLREWEHKDAAERYTVRSATLTVQGVENG